MLFDDVHAPPGERTGRIVAHVKKYYYPDLSEEKIPKSCRAATTDCGAKRAQQDEQEYLMG